MLLTSVVSIFLMALPVDGDRPPRAEHNLVFNTPIRTWDEALPLGNGLLGALVWGDGAPLRISLDRTDLWDLRPVPEYHQPEYTYETMRQWEKEGKVKELEAMYDNPYNRPAPTKIPAGRIEITLADTAFRQTSLTLAKAEAAMTFADDQKAAVWISATEPIGFIEIQGISGISPKLAAPAFAGKEPGEAKPSISMGDLRQLGYPPAQTAEGVDFQSYEQEGWGGFHWAVFLAYHNGKDGKGWQAAWSIATSEEDPKPLALAEKRARAGLQNITALRTDHQSWWRTWWDTTWLEIPQMTVEKQWYLDTYKFGAAARRNTPPITLQGPWTADNGQLPPWKGDYHHDLNTELTYWPCYSGNRLEAGLGYLDWLWKNRENARDWTRRFFHMPGLNAPMTADLHNNQIGGWRQYTHSATTGAWLAHHFYLHWKYSMDRTFLADRAYPWIQDCAVFLEAVTAERDAQGRRTLPLSSSPEINDNRPNAWFPSITNYDLALIRWTFATTAELATELGKKEEADHWKSVLAEMPAFAISDEGGLLVADMYPLAESHRHFSHLMAIHPLGIIDRSQGASAEKIVTASLADLDRLGSRNWCGYSFAWLAALSARNYDGEKAAKALQIFADAFVLPNGFHCNGDQSGKGYSSFDYRPFTLEGNFAAAAGLQEMLLQSHRGYIEVFPAIPASWTDTRFHRLRAQGAFLVSAERQGGVVTSVTVESEKGNPPKILSPWSNEILDLSSDTKDNTLIITRDGRSWNLTENKVKSME